jgi:hypothetical protein
MRRLALRSKKILARMRTHIKQRRRRRRRERNKGYAVPG